MGENLACTAFILEAHMQDFGLRPFKVKAYPLLLLCNAKCLAKQQQVPMIGPWWGPEQSALLAVQRTLN